MEKTQRNSESAKRLNRIAAFLGFLGAINSMAIGFYLLSILFNPINISNLVIQGYIAALIIATVAAILIYGSYLILKNESARKGGKINLAAGLILTSLYIYYSFLSQPRLLSWFIPIGVLLIIPPVLSGIIEEFS